MVDNISLKDYILMNWNRCYFDKNNISKIKKKKEIEKDLITYMADQITYKDFVKRYTDYSIDNVSFNGLVDAFTFYKEDIRPFDFELKQNNKTKKLIFVKNIVNYLDDEDDSLNF